MRQETRLRYGDVPGSICGVPVGTDQQRITNQEYLLRDQRFAIHYRRGEGITAQLSVPEAQNELDLYLAGSTRAAIACINGLYPLHASGVIAGDRVYAFTGPSGAGKSTLAAGLGPRGFALMCDDTLVLDMGMNPPRALPGHKRLKLWPDAVELSGVEPMELVSEAYPKYFAHASGSDISDMRPLAAIIALAVGDELRFERLQGSACFTALDAAHYTAQLYSDARGEGEAGLFAWRAALARSVPFYRFTRPLERETFASMLDFIAEKLDMLSA